MIWCEAKWFDGFMLRAHFLETSFRVFVHLARLEVHIEQSQEFACLSAVILDGVLDGLLKGIQQIARVEEAASQVSLDLEGILPLHRLDPALHVKEVALTEESYSLGFNARDADGTGFTLRDVAYLLELEEIILLGENDTKVVGILRDVGMGIVYRRNTVPRLVPPLAFDALWRTVIVTLLLEVGWCIQIEYDDCYRSTLSARNVDDVTVKTHKAVQTRPSQDPTFGYS